VRAYEIILHEEVVEILASLRRPAQRSLLRMFDDLRKKPFRRGDFQESDADGRVNEVLLVDDWLVTFWTDHATREMRVVRLENANED
jgi:hypothetical protein